MNHGKRATPPAVHPGRGQGWSAPSLRQRAAAPAEGIRHILSRALDTHGLSRRLHKRLPLEVWTAAVGKQIALRARPSALTAGVLHILVVDHRWRDQLDAARVLLIERINQRLGRQAVRELRFGLAHSGFLEEQRALDPVGTARAFAAALPTSCAVSGARLLGETQLPAELHEALARAAGSALRRARPQA